MNQQDISRRGLFTVLGISTISGCLTRPSILSEDGVRLGSIGINNRTEDFWGISIRLERDGTVAYEDTHEVTPENEPVVVEPDWSSERATYTLIFHVDGEIQKHEFTAEDDDSNSDSCSLLQIMLDHTGYGPVLREKEETSDQWGRCN